MSIVRLYETDIESEVHREIKKLFEKVYDVYPSDYTFYHQPPHFRYLIYDDDALVGHLSTALRYVNKDGDTVPVFGISEFCVDPDYRNRGLATRLLSRLIEEAKSSNIDAVISLTDSIDFYTRRGFKLINCNVKWMMIKKGNTLGVINRGIVSSLVVYHLKPHDKSAWAEEYLDLLGPMF